MTKYIGESDEPLVAGDVLVGQSVEAFDGCVDKSVVTVGAGVTLECGQVTEDAAGKFIPLATAANANGVLLTRIVNGTAGALDYDAAVLVRGPSVVNAAQLSSSDAAALAALEALGIVARDEPEQHPA